MVTDNLINGYYIFPRIVSTRIIFVICAFMCENFIFISDIKFPTHTN